MTPKMAHLGVIMGCMFSAKTTELVRQMELQRVLGRAALLVGPALDTRTTQGTVFMHSPAVGTPGDHARQSERITRLGALADATACPEYAAAAMVAVDEGQFFSDLLPAVERFLQDGKSVWVAGLNGSWAQRPLGHMLDLVPLADEVVFLRALCMDCRDGTLASFTCRLVADASTPDVEVGAGDKYVPVCRRHMQQRRRGAHT